MYDMQFAAEAAANSMLLAARHHISIYIEGQCDPVATTATWAVMDGVKFIYPRNNDSNLKDAIRRSK